MRKCITVNMARGLLCFELPAAQAQPNSVSIFSGSEFDLSL
jgi:hypothetical protein